MSRVDQQTGGQVLAQALMAAPHRPDGQACHSLHAYFLRPGDPGPDPYEVDRSRDGGSFSVRRVVAIQHGAQIFILAAPSKKPEAGFEHQAEMPMVPTGKPRGRSLCRGTTLRRRPA